MHHPLLVLEQSGPAGAGSTFSPPPLLEHSGPGLPQGAPSAPPPRAWHSPPRPSHTVLEQSGPLRRREHLRPRPGSPAARGTPAPSPCGAEAPATACPVLRWRTSPRSSPARAAPPVNARGQRDPSTGPVLSLHPPYRGAGQEPRPDRLQGGWRGDHPASRAWGWTPAGPWAGAGARGVLATPQGIAPPAQGWGCRMHTHEGITGPGLSPEEAPHSGPTPMTKDGRSQREDPHGPPASWHPHPSQAHRNHPQDPIADHTQMTPDTGLTPMGPFTCRLFKKKPLHCYAISSWLTLQTEG